MPPVLLRGALCAKRRSHTMSASLKLRMSACLQGLDLGCANHLHAFTRTSREFVVVMVWYTILAVAFLATSYWHKAYSSAPWVVAGAVAGWRRLRRDLEKDEVPRLRQEVQSFQEKLDGMRAVRDRCRRASPEYQDADAAVEKGLQSLQAANSRLEQAKRFYRMI